MNNNNLDGFENLDNEYKNMFLLIGAYFSINILLMLLLLLLLK